MRKNTFVKKNTRIAVALLTASLAFTNSVCAYAEPGKSAPSSISEESVEKESSNLQKKDNSGKAEDKKVDSGKVEDKKDDSVKDYYNKNNSVR
ncbi:MAG: hypothetical protein Q4F29_03410 [Lachnospiraceae bacterium]|nr:hypothetical protein [Lachnospiraceae bacterium]